mmetsp:Transcript_29077/g.28040  ORF Transcript_29077/g.28040 Transcript_29077/m.28040 type:complete len:258 (+) Transcript_29077:2736-3509(+)
MQLRIFILQLIQDRQQVALPLLDHPQQGLVFLRESPHLLGPLTHLVLQLIEQILDEGFDHILEKDDEVSEPPFHISHILLIVLNGIVKVLQVLDLVAQLPYGHLVYLPGVLFGLLGLMLPCPEVAFDLHTVVPKHGCSLSEALDLLVPLIVLHHLLLLLRLCLELLQLLYDIPNVVRQLKIVFLSDSNSLLHLTDVVLPQPLLAPLEISLGILESFLLLLTGSTHLLYLRLHILVYKHRMLKLPLVHLVETLGPNLN